MLLEASQRVFPISEHVVAHHDPGLIFPDACDRDGLGFLPETSRQGELPPKPIICHTKAGNEDNPRPTPTDGYLCNALRLRGLALLLEILGDH